MGCVRLQIHEVDARRNKFRVAMEILYTASALKTFLLMLSCKDNVSQRQTRICTSLFPKTCWRHCSQSLPCTSRNGKKVFGRLVQWYICMKFKIFRCGSLVGFSSVFFYSFIFCSNSKNILFSFCLMRKNKKKFPCPHLMQANLYNYKSRFFCLIFSIT